MGRLSRPGADLASVDQAALHQETYVVQAKPDADNYADLVSQLPGACSYTQLLLCGLLHCLDGGHLRASIQV